MTENRLVSLEVLYDIEQTGVTGVLCHTALPVTPVCSLSYNTSSDTSLFSVIQHFQ